MPSKQVLVMRKFPGLRTGKYIAQGAHAGMGAVFSLGKVVGDELIIDISNPFVKEWITGRFTKITVYVNSEEELLELQKKAQDAGIPNALIRDAGLTEFKGVPTVTALGIGPGDVDLINPITAHLPLF